MISDFIVAHLEMTCFELSEVGWNKAISEHPELNNDSYINKTATAIIEPSKNNYFDNDSILSQFERLLLCMNYSSIFKDNNYRVDILVDNATTHTKALIDAKMFNKGVNTHCGIEKLSWNDENNNECSFDCYYESGPNVGLSKGLFNMCKELKIIDASVQSKEIKLDELRRIAAKHPAFKHKTKLEDLIENLNMKYNMDVRLIYLPKFHCELNPIEMYWAQLKNEFRKINNQSSNGDLLKANILNSRQTFMEKDTNHRLWSRFWRIIMDYKNGRTYKEIMKTYFNSSDEIKSHRKIRLNKL